MLCFTAERNDRLSRVHLWRRGWIRVNVNESECVRHISIEGIYFVFFRHACQSSHTHLFSHPAPIPTPTSSFFMHFGFVSSPRLPAIVLLGIITLWKWLISGSLGERGPCPLWLCHCFNAISSMCYHCLFFLIIVFVSLCAPISLSSSRTVSLQIMNIYHLREHSFPSNGPHPKSSTTLASARRVMCGVLV